jgi:hypothetical protein
VPQRCACLPPLTAGSRARHDPVLPDAILAAGACRAYQKFTFRIRRRKSATLADGSICIRETNCRVPGSSLMTVYSASRREAVQKIRLTEYESSIFSSIQPEGRPEG